MKQITLTLLIAFLLSSCTTTEIQLIQEITSLVDEQGYQMTVQYPDNWSAQSMEAGVEIFSSENLNDIDLRAIPLSDGQIVISGSFFLKDNPALPMLTGGEPASVQSVAQFFINRENNDESNVEFGAIENLQIADIDSAKITSTNQDNYDIAIYVTETELAFMFFAINVAKGELNSQVNIIESILSTVTVSQ